MSTNTESLKRAQEKVAQMRADGWKPEHRTPVEAMRAAPTSLRKRINAYCWNCCNKSKVEVGRCTVTACEFHDIRPWQPKE